MKDHQIDNNKVANFVPSRADGSDLPDLTSIEKLSDAQIRRLLRSKSKSLLAELVKFAVTVKSK